jgi:hypothetical protein
MRELYKTQENIPIYIFMITNLFNLYVDICTSIKLSSTISSSSLGELSTTPSVLVWYTKAVHLGCVNKNNLSANKFKYIQVCSPYPDVKV